MVHQVHESKKPFKCNKCDTKFTQKSDLKSHCESVHEGQKSFKCKVCESTFTKHQSLSAHIASVHEGKKGKDNLKILAINVQGIENKHLQIHNLVSKYKCSIAVHSEVETLHDNATTAHMQDFQAFCPPKTVTGPPGKETGVLMMVSNTLAASAKPRPERIRYKLCGLNLLT